MSAEVSQLPADPLYIYYCSGSYFDYGKILPETKVQGAFTKDLEFYKSGQPAALNTFNELTLPGGTAEGFVRTDEEEFFLNALKNKYDKED